MTQRNDLTAQPVHTGALCKPLLIGAAIGFASISIFLLAFFINVDEPNPAWPELWWIRPLAVETIAGAAGGVFYYIMGRITQSGGWKRVAGIILSVIVFIIGLWMGFVLGLVGTMWH
jgi:hypothetical protein